MENNYILDMIGIKTLLNIKRNMKVYVLSYSRFCCIKVKRICDKFDWNWKINYE